MIGKNATARLSPDSAGIARATAILAAGGLVAVPTETVYGLAARADSPEAVARIYAAKGRPSLNPLIVHVRDADQARRYAQFIDPDASLLAESCWPGPLTLVLPTLAEAHLAPAVTAGLASVAIRVPQHPVMRAILEAVDFPLAAPSANASGTVSPTSADHVLQTLHGRIDAVIDAPAGERGIESTIVALRAPGQWAQLRPGPIDLDEVAGRIAGEAGHAISVSGAGDDLEAPGQLISHYSPGKPIVLDCQEPPDSVFMIGFGAVSGDCTLSERGDLNEAAMRLYDCLHLAAQSPHARIAIAPIPTHGIGAAINDRLTRAAA